MFVVNGIDWHRALSPAAQVELWQTIRLGTRFLLDDGCWGQAPESTVASQKSSMNNVIVSR